MSKLLIISLLLTSCGSIADLPSCPLTNAGVESCIADPCSYVEDNQWVIDEECLHGKPAKVPTSTRAEPRGCFDFGGSGYCPR